jgi:hypothetical protein
MTPRLAAENAAHAYRRAAAAAVTGIAASREEPDYGRAWIQLRTGAGPDRVRPA